MPLYMDVHNKVEGLTAEAVAGAHQRDLQVQEKHGVTYLKYWFNADTGQVWCLIDAPSKEAAEAVHREAHGLVADELTVDAPLWGAIRPRAVSPGRPAHRPAEATQTRLFVRLRAWRTPASRRGAPVGQ
jgi:Nickel responsive protein SCO4226-like